MKGKFRLGDLDIKARILKEMRGLDPSGSESVLGERPSENIIYPIIPEKVWKTVPWFRWLVVGLSPQITGFKSRSLPVDLW